MIQFKHSKRETLICCFPLKKSRIWETPNLSTDAASSTNILVSIGVKKGLTAFSVSAKNYVNVVPLQIFVGPIGLYEIWRSAILRGKPTVIYIQTNIFF